MGLSKRRRLVLSLFTGDPDCTLEAALVKAGYSDKRAKIQACELRRNRDFLAAIEHAQTKRLEKLERGELTDQEVVNAIRDIDAECALAGPVAAFLALRLKANELLCKIRGLFVEKIELGLDEALIQRLEAGRKRAGLPPPTQLQ